MENNEVEKVEEAENADVVCQDCNGEMVFAEVQRPTPKLFTPTYYKRVCLFCTLCQKTGKQFLSKINKQQNEQSQGKI